MPVPALPTLRGVTPGETIRGDGLPARGRRRPVNVAALPWPRPSDGIRALYRALIKLCHPDLAVSDADRLRREEFTARVNAAYVLPSRRLAA